MRYGATVVAALAGAMLSPAARAGGSNYGIAPGALPNLAGKVSEWPVPTPRFARDPAPGPDGNIYITVMSGNKIGRFDTKSGGPITEYNTSGGPYGLALDKTGNIWFCRMGEDKLGKLEPKTGQMTELATGRGSRPRRIVLAPDGTLWVTLYGNGNLAKVDAAAMKVVREYQLPAGDAGPYAVNVDGAGMVWVNEINTDTVVRLNPANDEMRVVTLPSKNTGIRKMIVDAAGRLWYMGSHNGRLGMVE